MTSRQRLALLGVALAVAGCGERATATTPVVTVEPVPLVTASAIATASAKRSELSDAAIRTRMPEVGVTIVLPPETEALFDAGYKRYVFRLSVNEAMVELVESPAPNSDQEANAVWAVDLRRKEARLLEHGGGGLEPWWSVTTFEVRMGVEGRPGLHRLQRVSRVGGLLGLAGGRHARCSVAIEYDVEGSPRPESLERAVSVCRSMRPL